MSAVNAGRKCSDCGRPMRTSTQRAEQNPGTVAYPDREASVVQGAPNEHYDLPGYDLMEVPDADLIVTLHRTIDAQLTILEGSLAAGLEGRALALARAINGTS